MADLEFNEKDHIYKLDGRRLISVTQALQILDDRPKDPYYLQRGSFAHKATELIDRDELDYSSIDPQIAGYVDAYLQFGMDVGFKPTHIEHPFAHPRYLYAGKIDRIGPLNGILAVIDIKSGAPAKVDPLQGAAYWELAIANGILVKKVFDLYLKDNGTYKLEPVTNLKENLLDFLACVRVTRRKEGI